MNIFKHTQKSLLLAFFLLPVLSNPLQAQPKALAKPQQLQSLSILGNSQSAQPVAARRDGGSTNRTTTISPLALGSAANAYTITVPENNCLYANDSTGELIFVHRNNPTIFGGSGFGLRYDLSIDGGLTWNNDLGLLNPTNLSGRYPQVAGYEAPGNTTALAGRTIWSADHYDGVIWAGFNSGASERATSGVPVTQEVLFASTEQNSSGGMSEGRRGEYWQARFNSPGGVLGDSLKVYKGTYSTGTQSMQWSYHTGMQMPWNLAVNGTVPATKPSVAFSPDGNTGWIATLGDLSAGQDSFLFPILIKSTDGGATWGSPVEVDLNSFAWVYDSLRALWVDSLGDPASNGRATAAFEYDLTVDANGNPHMFFVIGTAGSQPYSIASGLAKYGVDLSSFNGGSSFDLRLVAPVLTFRTQAYGATASPITMDNYPQVSRTQQGDYIFYSWLDSDTSLVTGSQNGIGFGMSDNLAPNLRISGLRLADGNFTCMQLITDGDLVWEGRALFAQMAPEVFVNGSGASASYNLPIILTEMPALEPVDPTFFYYVGNDAVLQESDFSFAPGSTVTWNGCGVSPGIAARIQGKVFVDQNANNIFDGTDLPYPSTTITTTGITYGGHTNVNGDYNLVCAPNYTYSLSPTLPTNGLWQLSYPTVPYSVTPLPTSINPGYDFALTPVGNALDLEVQFVMPFMRPGFTTTGAIYVRNLGNQPASGTLTFTYDSLATLIGATPTWASHNPAAMTASWTLPTIQVFQTAVFTVDLYIQPSVPLSTSLSFETTVATNGQDINGYNNYDYTNSLVIGSYDPNDKSVSPAGTGANHQVAPGSELAYRIRFQNTGTASAINVVVRDTLDTDLDIATFKMLGSSHGYDLTIEQGRILIWDFAGINLPDSFSNEPASHGHIDFSIRPKANRPLGTIVDNSAAIYFDFNAPVITNVATIVYDVTSSVTPDVTQDGSLRIYPHPVGSRATVAYLHADNRPWQFELLDLQGRRVFQEGHISGSEYAFDRANLPAGLYLYRVTPRGGSPTVGRMQLQ